MPTLCTCPPTVEVPSGSTTETASPGLTRYSCDTPRSTVTTGVIPVAVSTVPPPPPPAEPAPPPPPPTGAGRRGHRGHPDRAGLEHHLAQQDLAGHRQAQLPLPAPDRRRGRRRVMITLGQPAAEAEIDQVAGQLAHIAAIGHARVERPVGGDRAVQQQHRHVAHRIDALVPPDDLPRLRQPRIRRARAALRGRSAASAARSPASLVRSAATLAWPVSPSVFAAA